MQFSLSFPSGTVIYSFGDALNELDRLAGGRKVVLVTDTNVRAAHPVIFNGHPVIIVQAGEQHKTWETIHQITKQLIQFEADRNTLLVGIGGGVVTDMTGFAASVYMRGIPFGFVPTSLLGMVDAAIGGKNGADVDGYKNMIGVIRQPGSILYDTAMLRTLPAEEWSNGFAEVIKYACIFYAPLFDELEQNTLEHYQGQQDALRSLIRRCVDWKNKTVLEDEQEKGNRKLLNFGHTAGHAIENKLGIAHGAAISVGMIIAGMLSEHVAGLESSVSTRLSKLLARYGLPTRLSFDVNEVMSILKMDKKRAGDEIDFIVLEQIGKARIERISFDIVSEALTRYTNASHH